MKKINLITVLLVLNITSLHAQAQQTAHPFEVAQGQASYLFTYSKIANILSVRKAETAALSMALNEIDAKCMEERFNLIAIKFSRNVTKVKVAVEYVCW
jgi:hypothetical protein